MTTGYDGYPKDFKWIDVRQIGLEGTASSGITLAKMARAGGVLNWDSPKGVEIRGSWKNQTAIGMWGLYNFNYLFARPHDDALIAFTLPIRETGHYNVRLTFPAGASRATNARIEARHADGMAVEHVDLRSFGFGHLLGCYRFTSNQPACVVISAGEANGVVAVEGVGFVRLPDSVDAERGTEAAVKSRN